MGKIVLYHGSMDKVIVPTFGRDEEKHDYGKGFYLTESIDLAKEWSVCQYSRKEGFVHKYELDITDLRILDFEERGILPWLSELMKHRDASDSKRYKMLAKQFIDKYGVDSNGFDIIKGWRANASYFFIAREFVRDNIDLDILPDVLRLGDLGIQYCVKSEKAYSRLKEIPSALLRVEYDEFNAKYNERDIRARKNMKELIDSDKNKVSKVFSTILEE